MNDIKALAGVQLDLSCGTTIKSTMPDATGRFLITATGSRRCKLEIDGTPASQQKKNCGLYFPAVNMTAGRTNVLPYFIWLSEIDTPHAG